MMENHLKSKKILLADDSSTVRRIIKKELVEIGIPSENIEEVEDGALALEFITASKLDLIISDWNMPNMTGLELLKSVKKDPNLSGIPFLMVTSESDKEKTNEAFESGADQFITKPFDKESLGKTILFLLHEAADFADKKVMVVDDSPTFRKIVIKNLKQAGFDDAKIKESTDGEDAIEKLSLDQVDLILTDWHMPKMDGLEFLKKIRANHSLQGIPTLMLTSEVEKSKVIEVVKAGVSDYVIKPFNAVELQNKIKNLFQPK